MRVRRREGDPGERIRPAPPRRSGLHRRISRSRRVSVSRSRPGTGPRALPERLVLGLGQLEPQRIQVLTRLARRLRSATRLGFRVFWSLSGVSLRLTRHAGGRSSFGPLGWRLGARSLGRHGGLSLCFARLAGGRWSFGRLGGRLGARSLGRHGGLRLCFARHAGGRSSFGRLGRLVARSFERHGGVLVCSVRCISPGQRRGGSRQLLGSRRCGSLGGDGLWLV